MGVVVVVGEVDDLAGVGLRRLAHPDPDELVLLGDRDRCAPGASSGMRLWPGTRDALPAAVEGEAVIAALDARPRPPRPATAAPSGGSSGPRARRRGRPCRGTARPARCRCGGPRACPSARRPRRRCTRHCAGTWLALPRGFGAKSTSPAPRCGEGKGARDLSAILGPCRAISSPPSARTIARASARSRSSGSTRAPSAASTAPRDIAIPRAWSAPRSRAMPSGSIIPTGCGRRCAASATRARARLRADLLGRRARRGGRAIHPRGAALRQRDGVAVSSMPARWGWCSATASSGCATRCAIRASIRPICVTLSDAGWRAGAGVKRGVDAREIAGVRSRRHVGRQSGRDAGQS